VGLQLLQLLAAVRSPGAANKHEYGSPTAEYICEPKCLAVTNLQREWWCHVANLEACTLLSHASSAATATQRICAPSPLIIIRDP
jgi:hypothetical protein